MKMSRENFKFYQQFSKNLLYVFIKQWNLGVYCYDLFVGMVKPGSDNARWATLAQVRNIGGLEIIGI